MVHPRRGEPHRWPPGLVDLVVVREVEEEEASTVSRGRGVGDSGVWEHDGLFGGSVGRVNVGFGFEKVGIDDFLRRGECPQGGTGPNEGLLGVHPSHGDRGHGECGARSGS